jgi:hypothetical protein
LSSDGPSSFRPIWDKNSLWASEGRVRKTSAAATGSDDNYWFRNNSHNQIDAALAETSGGARVRIAHLDTGYDPNHKSLPKNFRKDLARNFVDADKPKDATDRSEGTLFNNFSHGCGTLSILAGATVPGLKLFGCAPDAEIGTGSVLTGSSCSATARSRRASVRPFPRNSEARVDVWHEHGGLAVQAGATINAHDAESSSSRRRNICSADACRGLSARFARAFAHAP